MCFSFLLLSAGYYEFSFCHYSAAKAFSEALLPYPVTFISYLATKGLLNKRRKLCFQRHVFAVSCALAHELRASLAVSLTACNHHSTKKFVNGSSWSQIQPCFIVIS